VRNGSLLEARFRFVIKMFHIKQPIHDETTVIVRFRSFFAVMPDCLCCLLCNAVTLHHQTHFD
jgi:hypothetical protein